MLRDYLLIFKIPPISTDAVINYVLKIPTNKATGIDGISCSLLRLGITELAPCLAKLCLGKISTTVEKS
jgi:hypothetical protein